MEMRLVMEAGWQLRKAGAVERNELRLKGGWGIKQPIACCHAKLLRSDMPPYVSHLDPSDCSPCKGCNGGIH